MAIDIFKFKDELQERYLKLLNSDRGIQAKLAKSIGKNSSYFSEIKRGKPVNALHLKAVELVCGADKLAEIMSIDKLSDLNLKIGRAGLNVELLGDIIWAIEEHLKSENRVLDPELKARAIGLLYLHYMESEKPAREDKETIVSYLKLVV